MGKIEINNNFTISVNELIRNFRACLIAIIPFLEKVKIEWRQGQSYDDWDNISMALYQNIVCSSLYGEISFEYSINKYEFEYKDFSELDYISVYCKEHSDKKLAFISFQSVSYPLDYAKVAILNNAEINIGYLELKQDTLEFSFFKSLNGKRKMIDRISIVV